MLKLVFPDESHEAAVMAYRDEHFAYGEYDLHGAALLEKFSNYADWLKLVRGNRTRETVFPGWVPADTLLAVRQNDQHLVGIIDIRRELNDFLRNIGGHIGYGVRPSERRKGYATEMLRLALLHTGILGMAEVMLACHQHNVASRLVVEKNGGILLRKFQYENRPAFMFICPSGILQTARLFLRKMTQADFPALCKILQDDEVMYAYEGAFSDAEVQVWLDNQLRRYREDNVGLWAVILKSNNTMIGQCGLTIQPWKERKLLEVGYLFQKAFWHCGFATEAAQACRDYAFQTLHAEAVYSIIRDTNHASRRVAECNGMIVVDQGIKHYRGIDMPHVLYKIKRNEKV